MKPFLKNIFKMFASNALSLLSGVLIGFLVPKMMGLTDYADYKIYTLYLTYLGLLSLGCGDGLYLKYTGTDKESLDKNQIRYYLRFYYCQLGIIFLISLVVSLFFLTNEYRFIGIALSISILTANTVSLHQNLSLITSNFNEYSVRTAIKAGLSSIFVIILFIIYKVANEPLVYTVYILGILIIEACLALWYVFTYRDFNFGHIEKNKINKDQKYFSLILLGFPLLLSNLAGTIFLNLDRQFVSVLFEKETYAVYAFAYNMLSLITTMTSAVSLVLFPSMRKIKNFDVKNNFEKYLSIFTMVVCLCLLAYFPLVYFVDYFLPKYADSLPIFRIVLPGLILSSSISVIIINFFKMENKINVYFLMTLSAMAVSIGLNFLAYYFWGTTTSISWVSVLSLLFWYVLTNLYFIKKYKVKFVGNVIYILLAMIGFYLITWLNVPTWVQLILYLFFALLVTIIFKRKDLRNINLLRR